MLSKKNQIKNIKNEFKLNSYEAQDLYTEAWAFSASVMSKDSVLIATQCLTKLEEAAELAYIIAKDDNNANALAVYVKTIALIHELFSPKDVKKQFEAFAIENQVDAFVSTDGNLYVIKK